jgi:stearoyl-CoA desaturase (delta-9 desaturase)
LLLYAIGGWPFVVWGVFVRLVAVFHCTWFVNSATHKFGYRTYDCGDLSTNCWWVALVTYGEGWHNNHHAFQYSARHGLQWWEIDITWMTIWLLQALGLARKVKLAEKS